MQITSSSVVFCLICLYRMKKQKGHCYLYFKTGVRSISDMLFVLYIDTNPVFFKLTGTGILCTWWMVVYKPSTRWKEILSWNIKYGCTDQWCKRDNYCNWQKLCFPWLRQNVCFYILKWNNHKPLGFFFFQIFVLNRKYNTPQDYTKCMQKKKWLKIVTGAGF